MAFGEQRRDTGTPRSCGVRIKGEDKLNFQVKRSALKFSSSTTDKEIHPCLNLIPLI